LGGDAVGHINQARDALQAGDLWRALELAEMACASGNQDLEALALFWMALARDGLGEREEATALWRRVQDHPFANASDPLLSTRAAHNLSIQAARIGQDATSERAALTGDLLRQLSNPTPAPSALTRMAYEHVQVLASGNQTVGIAQLAPAILDLAAARPGLLSDDEVLLTGPRLSVHHE
jgi:hypothetical protein